MARVVVVGGGILGTAHAVTARRLGHDVVQIDRDREPRGATVRNFGLVWISGRAPGVELELALAARARWEQLAEAAPGIGFRPDGSLTLVRLPEELRVLEEVMDRPDAATRGLRLLDADGVRETNPAVRGEVLAGLHCTLDAVVEPRAALPALRDAMQQGRIGARRGGYRFLGGRAATEVHPGHVTDHLGIRHEADVVIACPGADTQGPMSKLLLDAPLRRVRLQMMQTEPLGERLATSIADGDTLRYYPAFRVPALRNLPPPEPVVSRFEAQLLVSQRADGSLTVGDTHAYEEPFDFAVEEDAYVHLAGRLESLLGRSLPAVVRRWSGVYSQALDEAVCWRNQVMPGVWVVTGPGGRGMTLAPAIADETWELIG